MTKFADAVNLQPFTVPGYKGEILNLTNVISSFNLSATTRILLIAHWDTRPRADQDKNPKKKEMPIVGANDGASGVAVLMEIARQLKVSSPQVGVDILFVDGEDYGTEHDLKYYFLGAKYFANNLPPGFSPAFGILLDMIGDKELRIPKDRFSLERAPDIVDLVWKTALELNIPQFADVSYRGDISDDHVPLNQAGIKTVDLIDFNYPDSTNRYWHTTEDTPDKCSAESLEAVGKVLMHIIYRYH
jgi:Zn-dependent M28 family amino/carboxypeptidase